MRVEVTQEDIEIGIKGNARACPLAHAFRRALPGRDVTVFRHWAYDEGPEGWNESRETWKQRSKIGRFHLPQEATDFVSRFDRGDAVQPTVFHVDAELP